MVFSVTALVLSLIVEGAAPAAIAVAINRGLDGDEGGALLAFALLAAGLFLARGILSGVFNFLWRSDLARDIRHRSRADGRRDGALPAGGDRG